MIELNNKELEKVVGGKLTDSAKNWLYNNVDEIKRRAKQKDINLNFNYMKLCDTVYDLPQIKELFSMYFDISDLN